MEPRPLAPRETPTNGLFVSGKTAITPIAAMVTGDGITAQYQARDGRVGLRICSGR